MRRNQYAVPTPEEILAVLDSCDVIRVGLRGDTYPYVVPLSFAWEEIDERVYIYVHGAESGLRHDLLQADNRVCVEADAFRGYVPMKGGATCRYESIIGFGRAERVSGELADHGLALLMRRCMGEGAEAPLSASAPVSVWRITISQMTGKRRT